MTQAETMEMTEQRNWLLCVAGLLLQRAGGPVSFRNDEWDIDARDRVELVPDADGKGFTLSLRRHDPDAAA